MKKDWRLRPVLTLIIITVFVGVVALQAEADTLRLATTTSTEDSGLLDELLPQFTEETGIEMEVVAVGTGQALEIGRRGDADILLVHAPTLETDFVADGYGTERYYIMYNDFVLVGPDNDSASVTEAEKLNEAFTKISEAGATFASRGDESGTHVKETELWEKAGLEVEEEDWYLSMGQGMGPTLISANEMQTYALTDRGTYLSMQDTLANLVIVFEGDESLFNPYGIIPVNPETHPHVNFDGAKALVDFFVRSDIQEPIGEFGKEEFDQPLFFPDAE